jgi:hypothetical protein
MSAYNHEDPKTWPCFRPLIIAHDVGAVATARPLWSGQQPGSPRLLGITDLEELPVGLFDSACEHACRG